MIKRVNLRIHVCLLAVFFLLGCVSGSKSVTEKLPGSNFSTPIEKSEPSEIIRQVYSLLENNYVETIEPDAMMKGAIKGLRKMKKQDSGNSGGFELPPMPGAAADCGFSDRNGLDGILNLFRASVERNRGYSEFKIAEGIATGIVENLDHYSALLTPRAFEKVRTDTKGELCGLGIFVTMKDGVLRVVSLMDATPAFRTGILPEDAIVKIDGEETRQLDLWQAVKKLRGSCGAKIELAIVRDGEPEPINLSLVRDAIPIESVKSTVLQPGFGYIRVESFRETTADEIGTDLREFEKNGPLKGLVLDLRNNPGGLFGQAIEVSDLFMEEGVIVTTKGRLEKHTNTYMARENGTFAGFPMAVLIDSGSASASEIVAGALQDSGRAILIGGTTFGKGSIQTVDEIAHGYGLKYTVALYYTPRGRAIQSKGIQPDVAVYSDRTNKSEDVVNFALEILSGSI